MCEVATKNQHVVYRCHQKETQAKDEILNDENHVLKEPKEDVILSLKTQGHRPSTLRKRRLRRVVRCRDMSEMAKEDNPHVVYRCHRKDTLTKDDETFKKEGHVPKEITEDFMKSKNTTRCPNVGLMLAHRLRRWSNINPTLGQHIMSSGKRQGHPPSTSCKSRLRRVVRGGDMSEMAEKNPHVVYRCPKEGTKTKEDKVFNEEGHVSKEATEDAKLSLKRQCYRPSKSCRRRLRRVVRGGALSEMAENNPHVVYRCHQKDIHTKGDMLNKESHFSKTATECNMTLEGGGDIAHKFTGDAIVSLTGECHHPTKDKGGDILPLKGGSDFPYTVAGGRILKKQSSFTQELGGHVITTSIERRNSSIRHVSFNNEVQVIEFDKQEEVDTRTCVMIYRKEIERGDSEAREPSTASIDYSPSDRHYLNISCLLGVV